MPDPVFLEEETPNSLKWRSQAIYILEQNAFDWGGGGVRSYNAYLANLHRV